MAEFGPAVRQMGLKFARESSVDVLADFSDRVDEFGSYV